MMPLYSAFKPVIFLYMYGLKIGIFVCMKENCVSRSGVPTRPKISVENRPSGWKLFVFIPSNVSKEVTILKDLIRGSLVFISLILAGISNLFIMNL